MLCRSADRRQSDVEVFLATFGHGLTGIGDGQTPLHLQLGRPASAVKVLKGQEEVFHKSRKILQRDSP
jgi:hypothetical protein